MSGAPTPDEAIDLRDLLVASLRAWLTTSGDVDHSLGITLRRAAVERGDPPFAALRGATRDLISAGLAVEVGGCLKIAPRVHFFLQEQAGELGEPGTRGLKRRHATDDEQDSAPPPPPAHASAAGRGAAAPTKQQPRRSLPRVPTRAPPALRHCVEAGLSLLLEWRLEQLVQPELRQMGYCLCGRVFNHPTLADGSLASSSVLVSVRGREATTISGTIYHLGDVDPIFRPRCDDDGAFRLGISGYDGAGTDGVIEATCSPAAAQPSGAAEATQPMMAPMTAPKTAPMATAPALELSSTPPEAAPDARQFGSLESFAEDKKELDEDEKPEIMPEIKPHAEAKMELEDEIPEIEPEIKPLAEVQMELEDEEMPEIEPEIEPEDAPEEPGAELEDKLQDEQMDEPKPAEEWNCKALPMAPDAATEEANSVSESNSEAGAAANAQANAQANVQTNALL
ncbi:hypothetical protein Ctob_004199 [Chrysochromulina tobinii]|uniref:Uncharacterized protein n=1 Tax=Chrysochromulina tobinii TaxID=1460289 RepID=A0A0M0JGF8_9EUKA|nr:hypothetical protein Ctob_004199 [Chrysochromulina tobinii]|eukprot:KOO25328.1 hypothetical protein Ctob_004199 [Chrysochromulina sp. CCMP291]